MSVGLTVLKSNVRWDKVKVGHAHACLSCISQIKRGFCLSEIELWKPMEGINHKKVS